MIDNLVLYTRIKFADGRHDYLFKIGDMGLSREVSPGDNLTPIPHSPNYQHPTLPTYEYNHTVDWYSLGCIMERFTGKMNCQPDWDFTRLYQRLQLDGPGCSETSFDFVLRLAWRKLGELSQLSASPVRRAIETILSQDGESNTA
jgi:serine/threonine protein kinase